MINILKDIIYFGNAGIYSCVSFFYRLFRIKGCYRCPICNYYGKFKSFNPETGLRINAVCPKCGSLERHRLQYLVFREITKGVNTNEMSMLHFAPENFFRRLFKRTFKVYITADLLGYHVDKREDLTKLTFSDNSLDFLFASHILEHIKNDLAALAEIKRVLKPNGIAIIPVPVIGERTVEYGVENPHECSHVRCPGEDYYARYRDFFRSVKLYKSTDFDAEKYQLYIYEDRSAWPKTMPLRTVVPGQRHIDIVPVCFK